MADRPKDDLVDTLRTIATEAVQGGRPAAERAGELASWEHFGGRACTEPLPTGTASKVFQSCFNCGGALRLTRAVVSCDTPRGMDDPDRRTVGDAARVGAMRELLLELVGATVVAEYMGDARAREHLCATAKSVAGRARRLLAVEDDHG